MGKQKKNKSGIVFLCVFLLLVCVALLSTIYFYRYLNKNFFQERQKNIVEITKKIAQVVDAGMESEWEKVEILQHMMETGEYKSEADVYEKLKNTQKMFNMTDVFVLAFDDEYNYYCAHNKSEHCLEMENARDKEKERFCFISLIPHFEDDVNYIVFVSSLSEKIELENSDRNIKYVAVAVELYDFKKAFVVNGFQNRCYTYFVGKNGEELYENPATKEFLNGDNIIDKLTNIEFVKGGNVNDLRGDINQGVSNAYEVEYEKERYFVANVSLQTEDWRVLFFVPTKVLGSGTNRFMRVVVCYFLLIGVVVATLFSIAVYLITKIKNGKIILTQQRISNELLKEAYTQAKSANEAKTKLFSHISHDIRTPINGIIGMTMIAQKSISDSERVEYCLNKINHSSKHLLALINNVLDMNRIESGKINIELMPIDMCRVINDCKDIVEAQLESKQLEFNIESYNVSHPFVLGDELHLRQIFINILGNAIKFTPDGGNISFRIREKKIENNRVFFEYEIQDSGVGMNAKYLEHIWEAYTQDATNGNSTHMGVGLGMNIVKQYVDAFGGNISVESELGKGSKFNVELSFEIATEYESKTKEIDKIDIKDMNVLVVEDNEVNIEFIEFILFEYEANVILCKNGQEAVEIFGKCPVNSIDVILMDIMMPVMDGFEATKCIRNMNRADANAVKIVALTANAYEEDIRKAKIVGMNEHLSKPVDTDELLSLLSIYKKEK